MTLDLDTMARAASDDLRDRTEAVDTEAALAALHRSIGTGGHRARRLASSPRALVLAAAAVVLLAALAFAVGTRSGDKTERLGTQPSEPVDPTSYGPLLGTLHGADDPALRVEVFGPEALDDGSQVAIVITGGRPGQDYLLTQCATGDPAYNPAANCNAWDHLQVGADGSAVGVADMWAVFGGGSMPYPNDCRAVGCELQISAVVEEGQPDAGLPGTALAPTGAEGEPAAVPLSFAPDAAAPPVPTMTATFVERSADGMRVRIEGADLPPGRFDLVAAGYPQAPTGMVAHLIASAQAQVAAVVVPSSGRLSATVTLPDAVTDASVSVADGEIQDPEVVACGVGTSTCQIWVLPDRSHPGSAAADGRGILTPRPVPYPEPR